MLITEKGVKLAKAYQQLEAKDFDVLAFYKSLKRDAAKHYIILVDDAKLFLKGIKKQLTLIKAAGGLVENAKGQYLFIFRNKKWDLPKGKLEKGERMKEAAVREVEEECGITIERRDQLVCKTYHIYEMNGQVVLKKTNWYKMSVKNSPKLVPQLEEGITEAEWVEPVHVVTKTKNTYPLITEVLEKANLLQKSSHIIC